MAFGDHVQSTSEDAGTVSTRPLAFASNNVAGNTLSVLARIGVGTADQITGITDSQGNTWAKAKSQIATADHDLELWYALNCKAGANTVTINLASSATLRWIIQEHEGNMAFDAANGATGTSFTADSGAITTADASELLLGGASVSATNAFTATGGFTQRQAIPASPASKIASQDRVVAAGTYNSTTDFGGTDLWAAVVAAFKLAASGNFPPVPESALMHDRLNTLSRM